jgi:hypothetical protein
MSKTIEDLFHDSHLQLQELMNSPVTFHSGILGNIMYLQQVLRQHQMQRNLSKPSSKESMDITAAKMTQL